MSNDTAVQEHQTSQTSESEEIEGLDTQGSSWGDYPIDEFLIRSETRTVQGVIQRIVGGNYLMNPDFQRDFIWSESKQSKLIESVIMRIPLPVFYMAEDKEGRMIVVDGLQRLSTFHRFLKNELSLKLNRAELKGKRFSDLSSKFQNRVEDCNLIFYIIDSKVPEQARLDIFDRVNSGVPLTRQQMRNCLYMGKATRFLKEESQSEIFLQATDRSLKVTTMRDREFVNRFCAFQLLDLDEYRRSDMDEFLAQGLSKMNTMEQPDLSLLAEQFRNALENNFTLFGRQAFRKHKPGQSKRGIINASFWDVMSTGLSRYTQGHVRTHAERLRGAVYKLLRNDDFVKAITYGPNDAKKVKRRFCETRKAFQEILGAHSD